MAPSTAALRTTVIEAALHAAGVRDVRVHVHGADKCTVEGCVTGADQEALVRRLIANAGISQIVGTLIHVSEIKTEVDARVHKVQVGDSWRGISVRYFGDGRHHAALREANGNPDALNAGELIIIPNLD